MNNLPLKALKWTQKDLNPLAELELTAYSALHEYVITEPRQGKFEIKKTRLGEPDKKSEDMTGFTSVKDAQDEAWDHYNEKMQPYVKPMPTWIDVSERLPEQNTEVLVRYHAHFDNEEVKEFDVCTAFFYGTIFEVKDQQFYTRRTIKVAHWMPIPEFSTTQNNKGE